MPHLTDDFSMVDIHHASLLVQNTKHALDFYVGILGLKTLRERPDLGYPGAWLDLGKRQIHLLELPNPDSAERPKHGGRDRHLAFRVTGLDSLITRLEQHGIPFSQSRSGRKALFCRDFDGNALEFIEDSE